MKMKWFIIMLILIGLIQSCGGDEENNEGKPTKEELKVSIKEMEDSLTGLQKDLSNSDTKQIPNLTQFELINRLLAYYHNYPEDPYAAECLDKVHMKYSGMNIPLRAVQYADTLLEKYPDYPNRAMVLESQGSTYDISLKPRDTAKVRYYYEMLLKENPEMDKDKKEGLKLRLKHIDMTFEEFIEYRMNSIVMK